MHAGGDVESDRHAFASADNLAQFGWRDMGHRHDNIVYAVALDGIRQVAKTSYNRHLVDLLIKAGH